MHYSHYIVGGVVLALLLFTLCYGLWWFRKRRHRPIRQPQRADADALRRKLSVDVDSSPLTNPQDISTNTPYYFVLDTETFEAISFLDESHSTYRLSRPIALSWQLLDQNAKLIEEHSYIIRQDVGVPMLADAIAIHGISNDRMLDGAMPEDVYLHFAEDIERSHCIVAHNLNFHIAVLIEEFSRLGLHSLRDRLRTYPETLCTMMWGRDLGFKHIGSMRLYPTLDELFCYLYFRRMHLPLFYKDKTIRDIRLVAACLRVYLSRREDCTSY